MKTIALNLSVLFLTAELLSPNGLFAANMDLNGINDNLMENVNIEFNGTQDKISVGAIKGTLNSGISYFFCYDLNHTISIPQKIFNVTVLNPTSTNLPSNLMLPSTFNLEVATSMLNSQKFSTYTSVNQFAGLQLAIWTVLYDWSKGVTPNLDVSKCTSGFCVPGASSVLITDANQDLAQARVFASEYPNDQSLGNWVLLSSTTGTHTNQVLIGLGAPEPQTYVVLGSLIALTLCTSKFKKAVKHG